MREGLGIAIHRQPVKPLVQVAVLEPKKFSEVVTPGRALVAVGGSHRSACARRLLCQGEVDVAHREPIRAPVFPVDRRADHPIEVIDVDSIRGEARPPMARCNLDTAPQISGHPNSP